jgi:hypothetical protein
MARHKLPIEIKREAIFGRIDPKVNEYLKSLGAPNMGRAVDRAVSMLMEFDPKPSTPIRPDGSSERAA